jgi:hypothetical protein
MSVSFMMMLAANGFHREDEYLTKLSGNHNISGSNADFIQCNTCGNFFKQKLRTVLHCYKFLHQGDLAGFIEKHDDLIDGKIKMDDFKTKGICKDC